MENAHTPINLSERAHTQHMWRTTCEWVNLWKRAEKRLLQQQRQQRQQQREQQQQPQNRAESNWILARGLCIVHYVPLCMWARGSGRIDAITSVCMCVKCVFIDLTHMAWHWPKIRRMLMPCVSSAPCKYTRSSDYMTFRISFSLSVPRHQCL